MFMDQPPERRSRQERRKHDAELPAGQAERRVQADRRFPELDEYECFEEEHCPGIHVLTFERIDT